MPNHIINSVKIEGPKGEIKKILDFLKPDENPEIPFDFNKINPMPKSLDIPCSAEAERATKLYAKFYNIASKCCTGDELQKKEEIYRQNLDKDEKRLFDLGKIAVNNLLKYGHATWYSWRIENWGTKWNSYEPHFTQEEECLSFTFDTAWSTPKPIYEKFSELFPTAEITVEYADEDYGYNCGKLTYKGGVETSSWIPEPKPDGVNFACKLWGVDPDEFLEELEEDDGEGGLVEII